MFESIKDTYKIGEVAELFGVTPKTIRCWVNEGKLHPIKFGSSKQSRVLFPKSDVNGYINKIIKGE